jgi:hypothetical protein
MQPEHNPDNWQAELQSIAQKHENKIQGYLEAAIQLTQASHGFVAEWHGKTQKIDHVRAVYNMEINETNSEKYKWLPQIFDEIRANPKSILGNNLVFDPLPLEEIRFWAGLRTLIAVPLIHKTTVWGLVYVDSMIRFRVLTNDDVAIVEYTAAQILELL